MRGICGWPGSVPTPGFRTQLPCSLWLLPTSERIIVGSVNVRPALLPVGRLVEQVWGGLEEEIINTVKQPALLQA